MGASFRKALTFADGFFETNEESLLKIIQIIRTHQPELVLANTPSDRHPDHARGSELVKRASFLAGLSKIQTIGDNGEIQQPHRPKSVFFYIQDRHLDPHFVVDISDEFQQKVECIKAFKSQFYDPNSKEPETPISSEEFWNFIEGRAREFGRPIAVKYAEGFISERGLIGVDQLFDIY
jgi:bacillithiol biosynthesis deacetylase BshB1